MVTSRFRVIVEEGGVRGDGGAEAGDIVFVAVGNSVEKSVRLLHWTLSRFGGKDICLLHVHELSSVIPTLLGKLPLSQANGDVVAAYRKEEREKTTKLLGNYMGFCQRAKVKAGVVVTEAEQVQIGIVDLVNKHNVRKLVMGTMADNYMRINAKKSSSKADYAAKNIPLQCEIWFVNKGKHVWTKEAVEGLSASSPLLLPVLAIAENFRTQSSECDESNSFNQECPQSCSGNGIDSAANSFDGEPLHVDGVLSSYSNICFSCPPQFSSCPGSTSSDSGNPSVERRVSSDPDSNVEERGLHSDLKEAIEEAEASMDEAIAVQLRCRKFELEAADSIRKFKVFKSISEREIKLRKEAEGILTTVIQEQEILTEERKEVLEELDKTMKSLALLNSCTQEVNQRLDKATGELQIIQASIAALRKEKQKIHRQKRDALNWLGQWKSEKAGSANYNKSIGLGENWFLLDDFSLLDLQTATCDFSESFKIGQEGYGCLYKGEMLGKTVTVRRLHPHNILCQSEFGQEVEVLGRLQHPHLVTLLGVCTEACSLVYEYLPNGNLQNHLFQRGNTPPLEWRTRARIIGEVASALCFLHSSKPEKIVHGDLKPENIHLDSEFISKICNSGIHRLVSEDTLYCPSFRRITEPKGAFSYTDPEFQQDGVLMPKSDIYSFGLIILQLLTGRPIVGLAGELRKAVAFGQLRSVLDSSAGEWPMDVARRLVDIGLQCCELKRRDRPELTPTLVRELKQLQVSEERPVPSYFLCPILQEIMQDSQLAADGFTYEGEAISEWLNNGRETSPMTNLKLNHLQLTPNHALRIAIQDWLCRV